MFIKNILESDIIADLFFTADTHFGHFNIIEYTKRPFKSSEHMNKELIRRWNERVKPEDTVIIVGDFCFKASEKASERGNGMPLKAQYYANQLNGHKIFIKGNHDTNNGLTTKITALIMEFGGIEVYITHDPANSHPVYQLNICGHVHKLWKCEKKKNGIIINVGVDVNDFYPISLREVLDNYNRLKNMKVKNYVE